MLPASAEQRAARVRLMGFDVDGTLTDGGLYFGRDGEAMKRFCVFDGHGLRSLLQNGIAVAWITARNSSIVEARAHDLGISHVVQACKQKRDALDEIRIALDLSWEQCGFFGDDWPDLPALQQVGFAATTSTAPGRILAQAHWIARRPAGHGAARDLCDFIGQHQGWGEEPTLSP
ncbi:MAG: KdsC family phosphatase [Burkholderiaceae bacterium]